jgi:hypothetical protein
MRCIPGVDDSGDEVSGYTAYFTDGYRQRNYLAVSGDRLLMVHRRIFPADTGILKWTGLFKVFEAADLSSSRGPWTLD